MRPLLPTLALACALPACGTETEDARPSIVFVSVDTLGARHMSLYGYARPTTPGLDRLAESSIVFERCWANAPWTAPSYMSQFTGLLPASFRNHDAEAGAPWSLAPSHPTLAEVLAQAGYDTAAFIDNPNAGPLFGLQRGFEHYDDSAAEIGLEDVRGGIHHVAPRALAWLDGREPSDAPFLLFVQVLDVHGPYLAGEAWEGALAPGALPEGEAPVALGHESILGAIPLYIAEPLLERNGSERTTLPIAPIADAYDRGVRALDDALAEFVRQLEERGVLDEAWLLVTADHGESLAEHDSYFDHQLLHGEELHVPLLFRPPGGSSEARRVTADVQLVDLYPTLLDLAEITPPKGGHGRSLGPALRGEALAARPAIAFGDFQASRCIVREGWKLVETAPSLESSGVVGFLSAPRARAWIGARYPEFDGKVFGTHELPPSVLEGVDTNALYEEARHDLLGPFRALYDLRNDPGETRNVAADHPALVDELLGLLREAEEEARTRYVPYQGSNEMDDATRDALHKLGYAEGGG